MKAVTLVALFAATALAVPANAQSRDPATGWQCFDNMDQLRAFETEGPIRLNNISIREAPDMMSGVSKITFKASIANRSRARVVASVEVIGSAGATSLFAISARPSFDAVNPGDNAELTQSIFAEKDTLARADGGCIKFVAFPTK
ncbi:hypothetical protein [Aquabacter cavernae]|uniref:hypothetical protein n=1 Tax=Aquabacter cavernae TaxID=2496029 RepID=UPI000F8CDBFD|nr:hypothetical protein [Aquabacter cavernae]